MPNSFLIRTKNYSNAQYKIKPWCDCDLFHFTKCQPPPTHPCIASWYLHNWSCHQISFLPYCSIIHPFCIWVLKCCIWKGFFRKTNIYILKKELAKKVKGPKIIKNCKRITEDLEKNHHGWWLVLVNKATWYHMGKKQWRYKNYCNMFSLSNKMITAYLFIYIEYCNSNLRLFVFKFHMSVYLNLGWIWIEYISSKGIVFVTD